MDTSKHLGDDYRLNDDYLVRDAQSVNFICVLSAGDNIKGRMDEIVKKLPGHVDSPNPQYLLTKQPKNYQSEYKMHINGYNFVLNKITII